MKCNYQINVECRYAGDNVFAPERCEDCELYENGARPTGCFKNTAVIISIIVLLIIFL